MKHGSKWTKWPPQTEKVLTPSQKNVLKELKKYNTFSHLMFHKSFDEIVKAKNRTADEEKMVSEYYWHSFFLDNNSVMNRISRYMLANLGLVSKYSNKLAQDFDYKVLQDETHNLETAGIIQMKLYLQEYKSFKRGLRHDLSNSYDNMDAFVAHLRKECAMNLTSNDAELADYAVEITYGDEISMVEFPWRMFPQGMLQNIMKNNPTGTVQFPLQDDSGNIHYLWNTYSMKEFSVEELYDEK